MFRGVNTRSQVTHIRLLPEHEFVLSASDGVWDVMSSSKAVNFVRRQLLTHRCAQRAARELVAEAIALGSHDNTSALVIVLHQTA